MAFKVTRLCRSVSRLGTLVIAVVMLAGVTAAHADGWDYVYGDPGPANYSRYQAVELAADGSVYLAGFFSGSFNGLNSPDAYRYFIQRISTAGVTLWTKEVPTAPLATQYVPLAPDLVMDGLGNPMFRVNSGWWAYSPAGVQVATATVGFEQPVGFAAPSIVPSLDGGAVVIVTTASGFELQHRGADLSLQWSFDLTGLVDVPTGCGMCARPAILGVADGTYWVVGQKNKVLATQQNALSMVHVSAAGTKITSILHYGLMPAVMNNANPIVAASDTFIWITAQSSNDMFTPLPVMSFATSDGHLLGRVDAALPSDDIHTANGTANCGKLDFSTEYPLNFDNPPFPPEITRRRVLVNGTRLVVAARCSIPGAVTTPGSPPASTYAVLLLSYAISGPLGGRYALTASRQMSNTSTIYAMDADGAGNAVVVGSTTNGVVYAGPIENVRLRTEAAGNEQAVATRNPLGNLSVRTEYHGLTPVRLFDTRPTEAQGAVAVEKAKIGGTKVLAVRVAGKLGVPANGAGAVALNVTVVDPSGAGFLTVYPCGTPPNASNVNYAAGQTVANAVIAPLSDAGEVCFAANVNVHVLADVSGWFQAGLGFSALAPVRVFDTRPDHVQGAVSVDQHPYGGGSELRVKVAGTAGVPAEGANAVSLNVTAVDPSGAGYITVYPCGDRPNASNLNVVAGRTVANAVIAPLSPAGEICLYASVTTHLIADVNGWFASGSTFHAIVPARDVDTRPTEVQGAVIVAKQKYGPSTVLRVKVTGAGGVPDGNVSAVALNVTVVDPDAAGYLTVFPCGPQPLASHVNYGAGQTVPNSVLVPVSSTGEVCFYSNVPAHILADVNGWISG